MTHTITVGPGDEATWGPVVSPRDPRYVGFTGTLTTHMHIGIAAERVRVDIEFYDDEVQRHQVWYYGRDIAGCLDEAQLDDLTAHFHKHWNAIVAENQDDDF